MSSVTSYSNGQLANGTRRAWISTVGFGNNFYDYTTSMSPTTFVTTGTLTAKGLSASYPAGRVLRENGKKLYPGANPGNVYTLMVGVTDTTSFATGFIDPNSSVFALYNTDKASAAINGVDAAGSGLPSLAPPVFTAGNIETTLGNVIVDTGNVSVLAGTVNAFGNITTSNGNLNATTGGLTVFGNITTTNGAIRVPGTGPAAIVGVGAMTSGTIVGLFRRLTVNTTAVTANSRVFLTLTGQNNVGVYSVENIVAGTSFQIVSTNTADGSTVAWFIVN